jgi:integrase
MPVVKLTPGFVRDAKCEPGVTRTVYWDEKLARFGLQVTQNGSKSYVFQYRDKATRKQTRITYRFDGGLNEARKLAEDDAARLRLGENPTVEKRKAVGVPENTFKAICQEYIKREGGRLRSIGKIESTLDRFVYPRIGSWQIEDVRRSDIIRLLDSINDREAGTDDKQGGPVQADYTMAVIRKIMRWHASRSDDFRSPIVAGMRSTADRIVTRDRILTDDELRAIWKTAGESQGPFGPFLRLVLLTACRRDEVADMTYSEIVGTDWTIPSRRYKRLPKDRDKDHVVPLSLAAQDLIKSIPRLDGVDAVFTARGGKSISGFSVYKSRFDKACGVTGWTIHDLRRTARSLMSRAKVSSDHAERCLGHIIPGIRAVYDRHEYLEEKRAAFEALAALVDRIINPRDNVIPLTRSEAPA